MTEPTLTPEQLTALSDIYVVANTPAYLFKQFRRSATVQQLAGQSTADQLVLSSRRAAATEPFTLDKAAEAFATLIAATLRPSDEFQRAVRNYGLPEVRWAQELSEINSGTPSTNASVLVLSTGTGTLTSVSVPAAKPTSGKPFGDSWVKSG